MKVWTNDGRQLDAEFSVEEVADGLTIVFEQGGAGKNKDYGPGLDAVLSRFGDVQITAIYLERKRRETLAAEERLITVERYAYPIGVPADASSLRLAIGRAVASHRREQDAKGSGNRQKRLRIHTTRRRDAEGWERLLARQEVTLGAAHLAARRTEVEAGDVVEYAVSTTPSLTAVRGEHLLVQRYKAFMELRGFTLSRYEYLLDGRRLLSDLYVEGEDVLIEAKGSTDRAAVRLAVGQLLDYRRFHEKEPSLAILVPGALDDDVEKFLRSVNIAAVWESEDGFRSTDPLLGDASSYATNG